MQNFSSNQDVLDYMANGGSRSMKEGTTSNRVYDVKRYLNTRIEPGEKQKIVNIALLPIDNLPEHAGLNFQPVELHKQKVYNPQTNKTEWKTFFCLKNTHGLDPALGNKCPFCEESMLNYMEAKKATDDVTQKAFKTRGNELRSKGGMIVRCIDLDHMDEGVKFYRFNQSYKGDGIFDMIKNEMEENGNEPDFFDIHTGRKLKLTFKTDAQGRTYCFTVRASKDKGPIVNDENLLQAWVNDSTKWTDVYSVKEYGYGKLLLSGVANPYKVKETGEWVDYNAYKNAYTAAQQDYEQQSVNDLGMYGDGTPVVAQVYEAPLTSTYTNQAPLEDLAF